MMLQKLVMGYLVALSFSAQAMKLANYDEITTAVNQGEDIRVVMDFSQCQLDRPSPVSTVGSIKPSDIMLVKDKYISFSILHFTTHHPAYNGKAVYESNKFIFKPDNSFVMKNEVLNPVNFEPLGFKFEAKCDLNHGVSFYTTK